MCRRFFIGMTMLAFALRGTALAQHVEVESLLLENGMEFLLVERPDQPNSIAAGWVAKVGSANERPGITGISHFFEHMMFKGTRTIGTRDAERDRRLIERQKAVKDRLNELVFSVQYQRWRRGMIDDPWDPAHDTEEMKSLRAKLGQLMDEHRKVIVKDEFDEVYTKLGGSRMNAFTTHDLTFYFISVPSNKFELWAWMESDRLRDSVFREFYAERDVVHEERRLRTESTPTGEFREQFNAMFWQSSPYSWPVVGWPSDLNSYTRPQAERYFETYYRPNNIVGIVIGDFQAAAVKPVIRRYFGRLSRPEHDPPPVVTLEVQQKAQMRMLAECDCQGQVEVRYHTVPFNHADSFALEVAAQILNQRTGRLYKSMVEGREIASSASAGQDSRKYAGSFSFRAQIKGEATPQELEEAWYEEIQRLQTEPVADRELEKVKNRIAANAYRRLQSNFSLMVQLGMYEALGSASGTGWEYINDSPARLQAVTADRIMDVARKYFDSTNSAVAIYTRKATAKPPDPELAAMDEASSTMVRQTLSWMSQIQDPSQLNMIIAGLQGRLDTTEPGRAQAAHYLIKKLRERIAELQAASGN